MAVLARVGAVVLAAFLVVFPLTVHPGLLFGVTDSGSFFVGPKHVALVAWVGSAVVLLLGIGLLTLRTAELRDSRKRSPDRGMLLVAVSAALFALSPLYATELPSHLTWWGFGMRRDGAFLLVACLTLLAFASQISRRDARQARACVHAFLAGAAVAGALGILQSLGVDVWRAFGITEIAPIPPRSTVGSHALLSALTALG